MEVAVKGRAKRRHLSADDCGDLGRSAEGSSALTEPHSVRLNQGNRNPNSGLYPRTPSKRRKCASASSSPAGRQKGINEFFTVTGVLSSSPNKPQDPCSSTHSIQPRSLFHKDKPNMELEEEEEEEEEEEDDDVSLLAALASQPCPEDEEEVVDVSLLTAESVKEDNAQKKEEEVDYLEGITAEMFDEDFDPSAISAWPVEEEIEALPDAHFGLLGSSMNLQQPNGCMDDLPEEVLRQVLSLVPAQDLYRSVQLVCHRWKNIVQDPKFVPYKKQYFRYVMRESDTVKCVNIDLKKVLKNPLDHSIRNLVILMAQHKPAQRFRPDHVLDCVKKHRLFPQAEASIRLRIPVIQKEHSLGIEGTNPYAAMAVILLLSESVEDIQSLVSLLNNCLSYTAITEYLNHMAMMLLAIKRQTRMHISNRLHYNIYYVLHLMENGPFADQSSGPQINLTGEQQMVLSHNIQRDHVLKIMAFAGTGKTTTLVKYAERNKDLRFLYVAFNRSVAKEAERRFPVNVDCKTVHALAFREVGVRYHIAKKLTYGMKPFSINMVLPKGRGGFVKSKIVMQTISTFLASTDEEINTSHVPDRHETKSRHVIPISSAEKPLFVEDARFIWTQMQNVREKKKQAFYMTHDGYLKLWQLSRPCLSHKYDVIFIDEAQDCTPAILDIMLSQTCGKILVGDPHQQIYTFKGAVNALDTVDHTHIYYLTQSFRFGAEIAYVGAAILKVCKNVQKILVGGKQKGGVSDDSAVDVADSVRRGVSPCRGKTAILSRTNLTVFSEAVKVTDANSTCRIHFVGGIQGIGLDRIRDIWKIMQDSKKLEVGQKYEAKFIRDPFLRIFAKKSEKPFFALRQYAEQTEDRELEAKLSIVEKYGARIPELVSRLQALHDDDYLRADFILGTVHKAKGMEFDTVMVTDDFSRIPASRHNLRFYRNFIINDIPTDEWNLIYVAVTRAKSSLIISESIRRLLTLDGEYFLKSDMPSALIKDNEPLPCCVSNCPNCITPGSAFIMSRRQINCSDGVSQGGPLCERCVWARVGPMAFLMTDDVLSMAEIPENFQIARHHIMLLALF